MTARIPTGRFPDVAEVAAMTRRVASPGCDVSTGAVLDIPGGRATYHVQRRTSVLSKARHRALGIDRGRPLTVRLGDVRLTVAADAGVDGPGELDGHDLFSLLFAPWAVEAVLPASVPSQFQTVLDPAARTLTLASPGTLNPVGTPVPARVDPKTGVVTVEARIAGTSVPLVLDAGAPYTWLRGGAVAGWLRAHPDWSRIEHQRHGSNVRVIPRRPFAAPRATPDGTRARRGGFRPATHSPRLSSTKN
ncbi:hypothetical protein OPKNFCMD_5289 [Methylobacterium crusticola]|uniref:Retroviral-like aspartic protease n=1 Tax=Methylobacterium crusticola TaxID=1697972 RepID=A0ABQ4R4A3_9HYPH|nr:hypothetical protein [Methylobacterium crusticola]GJD52523.1 hypothetical protein OPKNFCMD_5289 [Methylobacterium crusticola]